MPAGGLLPVSANNGSKAQRSTAASADSAAFRLLALEGAQLRARAHEHVRDCGLKICSYMRRISMLDVELELIASYRIKRYKSGFAAPAGQNASSGHSPTSIPGTRPIRLACIGTRRAPDVTKRYRAASIDRNRSAIRAPLVPGGKKPANLPSASSTYVKDVWSIAYWSVPGIGTFSK